jgi:multiple sugar transport system permease protein
VSLAGSKAIFLIHPVRSMNYAAFTNDSLTMMYEAVRGAFVPLLIPALAGLSVLVFTFVWNDYFWALVLVQSDAAKPLTLGLAGLKGEWLTAWNLISAGSLAAALPPVALFFLTQRHFVAGLTVDAVKS